MTRHLLGCSLALFAALAFTSNLFAAGAEPVRPLRIDFAECSLGGIAVDSLVSTFESLWELPDTPPVELDGRSEYSYLSSGFNFNAQGGRIKLFEIALRWKSRKYQVVSEIKDNDTLVRVNTVLGAPVCHKSSAESVEDYYYNSGKCLVSVMFFKRDVLRAAHVTLIAPTVLAGDGIFSNMSMFDPDQCGREGGIRH